MVNILHTWMILGPIFVGGKGTEPGVFLSYSCWDGTNF